MTPAAPIRVLVVDDSAVIRRIITSVLEGESGITVVGTAANGAIAIEQVQSLDPDLVTLDVEMPVMDGLTALRAIRKMKPRLPVIMFSTLTEQGATATLDALSAGASDYVTKPSNVDSFPQAVAAVRKELVPKAIALTARRGTAAPLTPRPAPGPLRALPPTIGAPRSSAPVKAAEPLASAGRIRTGRTRPEIVAIGCSTGGPDALSQVLANFNAATPVPIVIVQHMPPLFTKLFAQRLDKASGLTVKEAEPGDVLRPGLALVAPGDFHLTVKREGAQVVAVLDQSAPTNFCRPAVDNLFASVAAVFGGASLGLILTGMGHDGREGARSMSAAGAAIVVQDEESSVVWGMPGAVAGAGIADAVLTLNEIGPHLLSRLRPDLSSASGSRSSHEVHA